MIGRHPDRWRLDAVGNPVIKVKLIKKYKKIKNKKKRL